MRRSVRGEGSKGNRADQAAVRCASVPTPSIAAPPCGLRSGHEQHEPGHCRARARGPRRARRGAMVRDGGSYRGCRGAHHGPRGSSVPAQRGGEQTQVWGPFSVHPRGARTAPLRQQGLQTAQRPWAVPGTQPALSRMAKRLKSPSRPPARKVSRTVKPLASASSAMSSSSIMWQYR